MINSSDMLEQIQINQYRNTMKRYDQHNHQLQYLQSLFNAGPLINLDPNNEYALVKTQAYNILHQSVISSRAKQEQLTERLHLSHLKNIELEKKLEICQDSLRTSLKNENQLMQRLDQSNTKIKQYDLVRSKDSSLLNMVQFKQLTTPKHSVKLAQDKILESISIQTDYQEIPPLPEKDIELFEKEAHQMSAKDNQQSKLYYLLHEGMNSFEEEFKRQILLLNQQQLKIDSWERHNEELINQNRQLKDKIHQIKVQEEQLKIWQVGVTALINKLEGTIAQPNSIILSHQQVRQKNEEQIESLKMEVIQLRGRIVEMKQKMKWVEQIMEANEEIGDQGAVGLLVRLSQKVKGIVKSMLMEIQKV